MKGHLGGKRSTAAPGILALALLAVACSMQARSGQRSGEPSAVPPPPPSPAPLDQVEPVAPVLRASFPDGVSDEALTAARETPGVAAAARLAIGRVAARGKEGLQEITVAAVEPLEFRPLAPRSTAGAEFVWRGLLRGELFLAHEEQSRLGVGLGAPLRLKGPAGEGAPRIGGLAANGAPNVAGALVSAQAGMQIGLGQPGILLVGVNPGEGVDGVQRELGRRLGVEVESTVPVTQRAFITGSAAARQFGSFTYTVNPNGTINPDPAWVRRNISTRRVPVLGNVTCHRLMFRQLEGALGELEAAGLAGLIDVADYHRRGGGCYEPRFVDSDPSRGLSRHAWGIAIDINKSANPEGRPSRQDPRLVATFERWGFRWGGGWSPPDPMHFDLAGLLQG